MAAKQVAILIVRAIGRLKHAVHEKQPAHKLCHVGRRLSPRLQTRRGLGGFQVRERVRADSCRSADTKNGGKHGVEERQWIHVGVTHCR